MLLSYDVDNETVQGLRTGRVSIGPLSQGQYGSRVALPRVVRLMNEQRIPSTFFFPAWSLKLAPEQADLIQESEMHEIAVHGWIHELNTALDGPTEERLLRQAVDAIEEITGTRPRRLPGAVVEPQPQHPEDRSRAGIPLRELAHGGRPALRARAER